MHLQIAIMKPLILHHVLPGSFLITDGCMSYRSAEDWGANYKHRWVDHSEGQYAKPGSQPGKVVSSNKVEGRIGL